MRSAVHPEGGGKRHDLADPIEAHAEDNPPAPIRLGASHLKARPRARPFFQLQQTAGSVRTRLTAIKAPETTLPPNRDAPAASGLERGISPPREPKPRSPLPETRPNTTRRTPSFAEQPSSQQDFGVSGSERSEPVKRLGTTGKHPLNKTPQPSNALRFSGGRNRNTANLTSMPDRRREYNRREHQRATTGARHNLPQWKGHPLQTRVGKRCILGNSL